MFPVINYEPCAPYIPHYAYYYLPVSVAVPGDQTAGTAQSNLLWNQITSIQCVMSPQTHFYPQPVIQNKEQFSTQSELGVTDDVAQIPVNSGQGRTQRKSRVSAKRPKRRAASSKHKKPSSRNDEKRVGGIVVQAITLNCKPLRSFQTCQRVFNYFRSEIQEETWSVKRYYLFAKLVRNSLTRYQSFESLKMFNKLHPELLNLFAKNEQEFYLKVARVLIQYYVKEQAHLSILLSNRITSEARAQHLNKRRLLIQQLNTLAQSV